MMNKVEYKKKIDRRRRNRRTKKYNGMPYYIGKP